MPALTTLLRTRSLDLPSVELNLETGTIFAFAPGVDNASGAGTKTFCWRSPGTGTVEIEIWGAAGSGARVCCCGGGVPGNPGAYSRKTISVTGTSFICGNVGLACNNLSTQFYRGVSEPTCVCWQAGLTTGAMCANGGNGGCGIQMDGVSLYCCLIQAGVCGSNFPGGSAGCGILCNFCCIATSVGGDINCPGGFSCLSIYNCNPCCLCSWYVHLATSPNLFAVNGGIVSFPLEMDTDYAHPAGQTMVATIGAVNALTRQPKVGQYWTDCWTSRRGCSCYDDQLAISYLPPGIPGPSATPCPGVRDPGMKGGPGFVRIRYVGT